MVVKDKNFRPFFSAEQIAVRMAELGAQLSADYAGKELFIIPILNGSIVFAADLVRHITVPCQISCMKVASYQGIASSGKVQELLGVSEALEGRHVLVVEDIVDTGFTMHDVLEKLNVQNPASIQVATFLAKPMSIKVAVSLAYIGFQIGPEFVVGYGMDYDGYGRELPGVWVLDEK
jgi:hypoxanthine phosphoribosyltransferase